MPNYLGSTCFLLNSAVLVQKIFEKNRRINIQRTGYVAELDNVDAAFATLIFCDKRLRSMQFLSQLHLRQTSLGTRFAKQFL